MSETQKFVVNPPLSPSTAWGYKGKLVKAGDEIEVPVGEIEKYKFRGIIGDPKPVAKSDVPVRKVEIKNQPRVIAQRAGDVDYPDKPKAPESKPVVESATESGDEPKKNRGGRPRKTDSVESGEVTE